MYWSLLCAGCLNREHDLCFLTGVYMMQSQGIRRPWTLASTQVGPGWASRNKHASYHGFWIVPNCRISKIEKGGDHPTQYLNFKDKDMEAREWFDFISIEPWRLDLEFRSSSPGQRLFCISSSKFSYLIIKWVELYIINLYFCFL